MSAVPPSPSPSTASKRDKKKKSSSSTSSGTGSSNSNSNERESFKDDEWQVVADSPANASSSKSTSGKKPSIPSNLTPTQRKSLQKANKNPHTGGSSAKDSSKVAVEDGMINEEEEDGSDESNSDDDDDDDDDGAAHGSDSEGETPPSDVDSEGEGIRWESKKQIAAKKKAAAEAAKKAPAAAGWSMGSVLLWVFVIGVVAGLVWIRLQDTALWEGVDPDDIDMTTKPPSEQQDHYNILQIPRNADLKQIKASYRKMVLATHPDKNPDCQDCVPRFQAVQKAYDVLSNKDKRAMYDSIETTYDVLQSDTFDLTSANFVSEVLEKDAVWVIEVYTDWHKNAIRFAQAWEEVAGRYGKLIRFGRIHAQRERQLIQAQRLPVKFGIIPTVLVYANGQFSTGRTFLESSHKAMKKFSRFVETQFPNSVTSVGNSKSSIQDFFRTAMRKDKEGAAILLVPDFIKNAALAKQRPVSSGGSNRQRFESQMLANSDLYTLNEPTLTYKAIARKFQYAFAFGQVEQLSDVQAWRNWIKDISTQYKLNPPSSLPAVLYQEEADESPKWLMGPLDKDKLYNHVSGLYRRMVPSFNSHSYARHCVDAPLKSPTVCVLAVACAPLKIGELEFHSFTSGARTLQKQPKFKNAQLQFGRVDVTKHDDMKPLCEALPERLQKSDELSIVVLKKFGTELYVYSNDMARDQQFDAWLAHVIADDGQVKMLSAPHIATVHIPDDVLAVPIPGVGLIFLPLKYLYLAGIFVAIFVFKGVISQHFASFVYLIFALSIIIPGFELVRDVYEKYM